MWLMTEYSCTLDNESSQRIKLHIAGNKHRWQSCTAFITLLTNERQNADQSFPPKHSLIRTIHAQAADSSANLIEPPGKCQFRTTHRDKQAIKWYIAKTNSFIRKDRIIISNAQKVCPVIEMNNGNSTYMIWN